MTMTLSDLSRAMREIDIAMLSTLTDGGAIAARPMSNNRDVEYEGSSYYFTMDDSRMVSDLEENPHTLLSFEGNEGLFVAVQGTAELIRDREAFREHWNPDLDEWFENGEDTDGLVLIHVRAQRLHYWAGEDDGEITL